MMAEQKITYRVEVRPLTLAPFTTVSIYSPVLKRYVRVRLQRGHWYKTWLRSDGRFVPADIDNRPDVSRLALTKGEADRAREQFSRLNFAVRVTEVAQDRYPHLTGDVDADASVLGALESVAKQLGVVINITSGKRTYAEQKVLYDAYLNGTGNLAAKPGTSNHERGDAVDGWVGSKPIGSVPGAREALAKVGLRINPKEAWHVSPTGL